MDVRLSIGLSFEIFKQVEVESPVIFMTTFDKYAIQVFRVNRIDYLLKSIDDVHTFSIGKLKVHLNPIGAKRTSVR